jgi:hypothetical protein
MPTVPINITKMKAAEVPDDLFPMEAATRANPMAQMIPQIRSERGLDPSQRTEVASHQ